MKYICLLNI